LEVNGLVRATSLTNPTSGSGVELGYDGTQGVIQAFSNRVTNTSVPINIQGDLKMNSGYGSSVVAYGCRAWVNFNGANGTIRASGGVSSITRNGTGDYTATLSFTMPDINYSVSGSCTYATQTNAHFFSYGDFNGQATNPQTTTTFRFRTLYTGTSVATPQDCGIVTFAVFR
jgi:hypothetical protein